MISLVIVNPSPLSPLSLLREGSKVKKGLKTIIRNKNKPVFSLNFSIPTKIKT